MYSLSHRLKSLSPFCTVIDLFWIPRLQNSRFFSQNRFSVAEEFSQTREAHNPHA